MNGIAGMAELADALDLGSSGRPCRFKSCYPQFKKIPYLRGMAYLRDFSLLTECKYLRKCVIILHVAPYFATRCNTDLGTL